MYLGYMCVHDSNNFVSVVIVHFTNSDHLHLYLHCMSSFPPFSLPPSLPPSLYLSIPPSLPPPSIPSLYPSLLPPPSPLSISLSLPQTGTADGFSTLRSHFMVSRQAAEWQLQSELKEQMQGYKRMRQTHKGQVHITQHIYSLELCQSSSCTCTKIM